MASSYGDNSSLEIDGLFITFSSNSVLCSFSFFVRLLISSRASFSLSFPESSFEINSLCFKAASCSRLA